MTMFFGFMGAIIFTTVAPLLLLLWCGRRPWVWSVAGGASPSAPTLVPSSPLWVTSRCPGPRPTRRLFGVGLGSLTWRVFGLMVAKGLLDNVLSDYLWARAILLVGACRSACVCVAGSLGRPLPHSHHLHAHSS